MKTKRTYMPPQMSEAKILVMHLMAVSVSTNGLDGVEDTQEVGNGAAFARRRGTFWNDEE